MNAVCVQKKRELERKRARELERLGEREAASEIRKTLCDV